MGLEERGDAVGSFCCRFYRDRPQSESVLGADLKKEVMLKQRVMSEVILEGSKWPHGGHDWGSRNDSSKVKTGTRVMGWKPHLHCDRTRMLTRKCLPEKGPEIKSASPKTMWGREHWTAAYSGKFKPALFLRPGHCLLSSHIFSLLSTDPLPYTVLCHPLCHLFSGLHPPVLTHHRACKWQESICLMTKSFMSY